MARESGRSVWRYDRAVIRFILESEGIEAAYERWPKLVVDQMARALGLTKPWHNEPAIITPEMIQELGTKPDTTLAAEWSVAPCTVGVTRRRLGISTPGQSYRREQRLEKLKALTDEQLQQPLDVLASQVQLSVHLLTAERKRRNIAVTWQGGRPNVDLLERRRTALRALRVAYPGITLAALAEVFNLTRERVRQLEEQERYELGGKVGSACREVRE
jgi:hypothetical protein